jgi:membrane-associated phospholipid phosphatase
MIDPRTAAWLFFAAAALSVAPAAADDQDSSFYFTSNINTDLPIIAVSAAIWAVPSAVDRARNLDICAPSCDPKTVNPWDRQVISNHNLHARWASDVLVVFLPAQTLWFVLADGTRLGASDAAIDLIILTEVLTIQGAVNQIVKTAVERPRPYMYREERPDGLRKNNADDYRSFYSSHTSTVFAVLTGAATIFSMRYPHNRFRYLIWAFALVSGSVVAALRTVAGKHFYTDVTTGAAAGIGVGIAVPWFHLRKQPSHRKVAVVPCEGGVAGTF